MPAFFFSGLHFLLLLPVWLQLFRRSPQSLPVFYERLFYCFDLVCSDPVRRNLVQQAQLKFRFNNGGSFLTVLLGLFGNTFPMNGNWYPDKYENTPDFRRDMAIPEIIKWAVFSLAALLGFFRDPIFEERFSDYLLLSYIYYHPLVSVRSFGRGRIYRFSRLLWLFTAVLYGAGAYSRLSFCRINDGAAQKHTLPEYEHILS